MEKEETMRLQLIKQIGLGYKQKSLWLIVGLSLAILFACRISASCDQIIPQVVTPLAVSAIFSLVASTATIEGWSAVAKSSPATLAKYYLAASVIKMLAAAIVFLIYVVCCNRSNIIGFTVIFALFYVMLLIFDCLYFVRVEKKNNQINK